MIQPKTADIIHKQISNKLSNGSSYIDALVEYANENNMEIETVAEIVKKSVVMKEKIRDEAVKIRMVKQDDTDNTNLFE